MRMSGWKLLAEDLQREVDLTKCGFAFVQAVKNSGQVRTSHRHVRMVRPELPQSRLQRQLLKIARLGEKAAYLKIKARLTEEPDKGSGGILTTDGVTDVLPNRAGMRQQGFVVRLIRCTRPAQADNIKAR
jgi:hypothetical protein